MANTSYKNKANYKNLVIALLVILGLIFVVLYFCKWHQVKEDEKYLESYLISSNTISLEMNDIKDIPSVLSETPNYYFIYISYTEDKNVYNFEKKLKPLIDDYNIQNIFYFLNITDIKKENKKYKDDISQALEISKDNLNKLPTILYFEEGNLKNTITTVKDFEELLKEQAFKLK